MGARTPAPVAIQPGSSKTKGNRVSQGLPPKSPRLRLDMDERRLQLLEFGKHFFATHSYDDVSLDEVRSYPVRE